MRKTAKAAEATLIQVRRATQLAQKFGRGRFVKTISSIVEKEPATKFNGLVQAIHRAGGLYGKLILPRCSIRSHQLFDGYRLPIQSFDRQLIWCIASLQASERDVRSFIAMRDRLDRTIQFSAPSDCLKILDEIDARFGASLWSIEIRLAIAQLAGGKEARDAALDLFSDGENDSLAAIIAFYLSERNDEAVTPSGFERRQRAKVKSWNLPSAMERFLEYKFGLAEGFSFSDWSEVLNFQQPSSIVDLFHTVSDITLRVFRPGSEIFSALCYSVRYFFSVGDCRFSKLHNLFLSDDSPADHELSADIGAGIPYLVVRGEPLRTNGHAPSVFLSSLSSDMHSALCRSDGYLESMHRLDRVWANMSGLPFIASLSAMARTALQPVLPSVADFNGLTLTCPVPDRLDLVRVDRVYAERYVRIYLSSKRNGVAPRNLEITGISDERVELLLLARNGDWQECLQCADALEQSGDPLTRVEAQRVRVWALLGLDRFNEAFEAVGAICSEAENMRFALPISTLVAGKSWRLLKPFEHGISLSIVLYLFLKDYRDERQESNLKFACKRLFEIYGGESFVRLLDPGTELVGAQYFLKNVCTPINMQSVTAFDTPTAVLQERLRICQALAIVDESQRSVYDEEIKRISYELELEAGQKAFDQSRIFVDTESIATAAKSDLKEAFELYKNRLNSTVATTLKAQQALAEFLKERSSQAAAELVNIPQDEQSELLLDMFKWIAREFYFNPKDGLDAYLSTRIRHGSLSGYLRGPLERWKIATHRSGDTGEYRENTELLSDSGLAGDARSLLDAALREFSAACDTEFDFITNDLIQIRGPSKPSGAFRTAISSYQLTVLRAHVDSTTTLDSFVDACFSKLFGYLELDLEDVRRYLAELKPRVQGLFEALRRAIPHGNAFDARISTLLSNLNSCAVEMQSAIDEVSSWFNIEVSQRELTVFSARQVVDIALRIIQATRANFSPRVSINISADVPAFIAASMRLMTDSLFIMLDNVYQHSGNKVDPELFINVATVNDETISVEVINVVYPGINVESVEAALVPLRLEFESGQHLSKVNLEGGSGLRKLRQRAAPQISGTEKSLVFGFLDEKHFRVRALLKFSLAISAREAA